MTSSKHPKPSRELAKIDADLKIVRAELAIHGSKAARLIEAFQQERAEILDLAQRATKRRQRSRLSLQMTLSKALGAPRIFWRRVRWSKKASTPGGQEIFFTAAIPKGKKHGWRERELSRYAHPDELALVLRTEHQLTEIRKIIDQLAATGTSLLKRRTHALRRLDNRPADNHRPAARGRKPEAAADQMSLSFQEQQIQDLSKERPQFRRVES